MNLRTKLIIVFAALAFLPLAVVCLLAYRAGAGSVESLLRERASDRAERMTRDVERALSAQESQLLLLAAAEPARRYAAARRGGGPGAQAAEAPPTDDPALREAEAAGVAGLFRDYAARNGEYLQSVVFLDAGGRATFGLRRPEGGGQGFDAQTSDFVSTQTRHDERVWGVRAAKALRSPLYKEGYGASLRVTAPVFGPAAAEEGGAPSGAVVAELRLSDVVREAGETASPGAPDAARARRSVVALDNATGSIVYHTNDTLNHQDASNVLPHFGALAARMKAGESGSDFYDAPEGGRALAAFRQAPGLGLSVAASEDYAGAAAPVRRAALLGGGLALVAGLAGAALAFIIADRETRGIDRVARSASAIAAGNLDQRIDISHSGETRELAENFNTMTERLRELIAREAESRQFQSFMRISAMVSHDLKNAIAGLSMLVSNMEKQFHREEFRADAIESLREATEKLKRTVARLSEPMKSLSGEYRLASRPADLVPIIRRVLATNAEPSRPLYDIEARLPETLVATVEPERVENVVENLVINALEAMGAKGGRLTVEAGTLEGDLVFFSVADTGVGMSKEFIRTRLYRPFSTTKNKGIGLGLFTCREVVEAHGGRLEVDSHEGAGTRFRVVLPSRLFHSGERRERPVKATAASQSALPRATE
ncbi:MAG TPA: ATP-binding protein [Pyrinomonadaceae bacterium]